MKLLNSPYRSNDWNKDMTLRKYVLGSGIAEHHAIAASQMNLFAHVIGGGA